MIWPERAARARRPVEGRDDDGDLVRRFFHAGALGVRDLGKLPAAMGSVAVTSVVDVNDRGAVLQVMSGDRRAAVALSPNVD